MPDDAIRRVMGSYASRMPQLQRRGLILKLECGHERWIGGLTKGKVPEYHRCLSCEVNAWH